MPPTTPSITPGFSWESQPCPAGAVPLPPASPQGVNSIAVRCPNPATSGCS